MKTLKNIQCYLTLVLFFLFANYSFSQEWEATDFGYSGHSIDFLDANTGFIGVTINDGGYKYKILKTTDKGVNFTTIWSTPTTEYNIQAFAFDMITEQVGYIYIDRTLFRTTNGGINWVQRFQFDVVESAFPTMKFANENLGFISYTQFPYDASSNARQRIYRITNGGNQWTNPFTSNTNTPVIKDISISKTDINQVIMVGYYQNYQDQGQLRRYTLTSTNAGASFGVEYD